jgi:hypothetical protein
MSTSVVVGGVPLVLKVNIMLSKSLKEAIAIDIVWCPEQDK